MSSNDEDYGYGASYPRGKKRRLARACDVCRRRKSRCDGSQMPGDTCSTCLDAHLECTYIEGASRRAPPKSTYVDALEARLAHSEALVRHLRTELAAAVYAASASPSSSAAAAAAAATRPTSRPADAASALRISASRTDGAGAGGDAAGDTEAEADIGTGRDVTALSRTASLHLMRTALRLLTAPPPPAHADDLLHLEIARKLERLSVGGLPDRRFHGKSSGALLIKAAIDLRADVRRGEKRAASASSSAGTGEGSMYVALTGTDDGEGDGEGRDSEGGDDAGSGEVSGEASSGEDDDGWAMWRSRRLRYWQFKPWENTVPRSRAFRFPPVDLMGALMALYFEHVNVYLPLLHRPTFERSVRGGLHLRDDGFAATLLLVCAVASRWSDDPRVVTPAGAETGDLTCGWEWFDQVPLVGNHLFGQATLYDLQYYCLAVEFLEGSSAPQACWTLIGVGLRLAQIEVDAEERVDVGAHRRTSRVEKPSVEGELWKRAFYVLVYMDRAISAGMGRTCAIQHDDFDLDPPLEVDDEYWEHPTHPFQQPPGVPSRVAFFATLLRLNHILSFSLKILYSLMKVRLMFSVDDLWEENFVAELDSALNRWHDEIPEHLRWDPARADPLFFDQSVALHCHYSHLQILIHRPFIPMVRKSAPTALPSLAICTSAARSCANMVDVQRQRKGNVPVVMHLGAVFTSGIILLLNVWSGKRTGLVPDPSREIANVHKCMQVVRLCEQRWQTAGLLWDILYELASVGQLPLPATPSSAGVPEADDEKQAHTEQYPHSHAHSARYPACTTAPLPGEAAQRIHLGTRGLRQTFERPMHDAQFRAPYAPAGLAPQSFAGVLGGPVFGTAAMEPSAFAPPPPPDAWPVPAADSYAVADAAASRELDDMMSLIDSDTIAMWTNAPMGVEVDDWGNYFSNFSEITQAQQAQQGMHGDMWGMR
ncbi:fungal-specific transcription factor domain-containing protein [Mycena belliarum]|uniref:Fungal-specific transcription factor domain-containing protein n=1 Tax=Mycena belliarum TaxID=1033014 RepID=A0AAD6U3J7_9AGAR|nr:fungal-specific transcription factor domain-containing protein [Mycena belliae]